MIVVIEETEVATGRPLERETRSPTLEPEPPPWNSVEDMDVVASPPSKLS